MYLTQPGEQLVNCGKTADGSPSTKALFRRIKSSVPSSMIVRSAVKLVSKTLSNPHCRRAVFSSNVSAVPGGRPKHSPMAARGLGAVWITTCFFGSSMAAQTSSVGSLARRAPVGQRLMHWPQLMQITLGQRLVHEGRDLAAAAAADGLQHAHLLEVDAGAHAAPAEHALVVVADHASGWSASIL